MGSRGENPAYDRTGKLPAIASYGGEAIRKMMPKPNRVRCRQVPPRRRLKDADGLRLARKCAEFQRSRKNEFFRGTIILSSADPEFLINRSSSSLYFLWGRRF
jgi:hypothetical protein